MAQFTRSLVVLGILAGVIWLGSTLFATGTAQAQGHVQDVNQVIEMASR
jgi:hypothetical protein